VSGRTLAEDAAELVERTCRTSGVPRVPTDPAALRRTAAILRHAEVRRGGEVR
jgi:hypothetical protein